MTAASRSQKHLAALTMGRWDRPRQLLPPGTLEPAPMLLWASLLVLGKCWKGSLHARRCQGLSTSKGLPLWAAEQMDSAISEPQRMNKGEDIS